jgi:hypothetical protein
VYINGLGQNVKDIFGDLGETVTGLIGDLDGYIEKLPVGVAGPYTARRDECMRKSTVEQYACLYRLLQDIKDVLKGGGTNPSPTVKPPAKVQASGGLPIVPIVIGGVAVAAVLYAVLKG